MRRIHFLLLIFAGLLFSGQKPDAPCNIRLKINGVKDTTVYLASYFGNKILRIDSVRLNSEGFGILTREKAQKEGIYLFYLNDKNYFEFLVGKDQHISIEADFKNTNQNKFKGAVETVAFREYQLFFGQQKARQTAIQNKLKATSEKSDSVKILQKELTDLNTVMESYWRDMSAKYKGTFLADFFLSMFIPAADEPKIAIGTKNPDSLRWVYRYNFMKDHYWDNFNFARSGLIRTPVFQEKLDTYIKKLLLQIPDSLIGPMVQLIEKSKKDEEVYHYIFLYLLNESNQSQIMGMDKVFVVLSEKYILNNPKTWLDTAVVSKIRERVNAVKPNLIGNAAPELKLPDSEGNYFSLRQMNGRFTLLYFWEPDCSHCQKTTPALNTDLYQVLKNKGVDIYAVLTQNNKEKWMKAIQDYKIQEWTNVWDPMYGSNFRKLYDVTTTPIIYILDKNKKIVAKRLDVESSVKFLKAELNIP
ncbi:MAG TPA: redoxin domain-containing protein [Prolixibacteraceae bacterium]|nr:redoxin domain-containing protein [Prolixibacteraceae bacterium]